MNDLEFESSIQNTSYSGGRGKLSLWTRREIPDVATSEETFTKTITVVDCWLFDCESTSSVRHDMQESEIEGWLAVARPYSGNGQQPSAGLRIIYCGQWESKREPFSPEVTQAINRAFELPSFISDFVSSHSGACGRLTSSDSTVFVCRRPSSIWTTTTVLRYDHRTNISVGYVYSATPLNIKADLDRMPSRFADTPHPLLVPVLMHEVALEHLTWNLHRSDNALEHIEEQSGFNDFEKMSSSGQTDYRPQIERLGKVTHGFAYDQVRLCNAELVNQFLRQQVSSIQTWLPDEHRQAQLSTINIALQERLEFLRSTIQHLQLYNGLEKRLQVRQNVLFNLIAQQDSAANIDIAAASQRDSSAMKVIAVLTTLFLLGTFVAAFFAMPMFDWQSVDGNQIVSRWFWIYWAVAIPLTIAIGTVIIRWVLARTRSEKTKYAKVQRDIEA